VGGFFLDLPARVRVFIDFMSAALEAQGESANHTLAEHLPPLDERAIPTASAICP
jgi:hypothetical protein